MHAFSDSAALARRIARQLGARFAFIRSHRFPNGEMLVRVLARAGRHVVVVHPIFAPGALAMIRRAGARRIVSCDTSPHLTDAIRCAPIIAAALRAGS